MYEGSSIYEHGVLRVIQIGIKTNVFPCLIFMGVGAMTDFGPLIANPIQLVVRSGSSVRYLYSIYSCNCNRTFSGPEAAAIGIIGGADGPTSIFLANSLAPHLMAPIAVAAYSYMALIPMIQPPIMKLLTTEKEEKSKWDN